MGEGGSEVGRGEGKWGVEGEGVRWEGSEVKSLLK